MSYILEGLKKLEKDRQSIGTQVLFSTSKSAPPGRDKRKRQHDLMLLAGILITVIAAGACWWISATKPGQSAEKPLECQLAAAEPEHQPVKDKPDKKSSRRKAAPAADIEADDSSPGESDEQVRSGENIVSCNQLPDGVQKGMPEIKVFMHYYSTEPKERFVQINEHTLHEGQSRPDGLKVVQITQDAAVLSYQGRRFQLRAVEK